MIFLKSFFFFFKYIFECKIAPDRDGEKEKHVVVIGFCLYFCLFVVVVVVLILWFIVSWTGGGTVEDIPRIHTPIPC